MFIRLLNRRKRTIARPGKPDRAGPGASPAALGQREVMAADPADAAEKAELRTMVWEAAGTLNARDYSVFELSVRQGLDPGEVAVALGVTPAHAYVLLSRLRDSVEKPLQAVVLARVGRRQCADLDAIVTRYGSERASGMREAVARHARECDRCAGAQRHLVSPAALLQGVPMAAPAPEFSRMLRARLLRTCTSPRSGRGRTRLLPSFGPAGAPGPPNRAPATRRPKTLRFRRARRSASKPALRVARPGRVAPDKGKEADMHLLFDARVALTTREGDRVRRALRVTAGALVVAIAVLGSAPEGGAQSSSTSAESGLGQADGDAPQEAPDDPCPCVDVFLWSPGAATTATIEAKRDANGKKVSPLTYRVTVNIPYDVDVKCDKGPKGSVCRAVLDVKLVASSWTQGGVPAGKSPGTKGGAKVVDEKVSPAQITVEGPCCPEETRLFPKKGTITYEADLEGSLPFEGSVSIELVPTNCGKTQPIRVDVDGIKFTRLGNQGKTPGTVGSTRYRQGDAPAPKRPEDGKPDGKKKPPPQGGGGGDTPPPGPDTPTQDTHDHKKDKGTGSDPPGKDDGKSRKQNRVSRNR